MHQTQLRWQQIAVLLVLALIWGANMAIIKVGARELAPLFMAGLRSLIASACLYIWMSVILEDPIVSGFSLVTGFSVFYQCIIVAFLSYLTWFDLIHRYPVSLLHAFSFFTPVFGVFLSGALILGELITPSLIVSLSLVSLGMIVVNRSPKANEIPRIEAS